jgi:histidinol-phosphate aminotransferase
MLKPRSCIEEISAYHAPVEGVQPDLRLDLNENTSGCSPRVLAKMRSLSAKKLALYPAREPGEKLVADFMGVKPEEVMLTNGADEGIDLLCRAYVEDGTDVLFSTPAFPMYEIFARAAGGNAVKIPAGAEYGFPLPQMLERISSRTRAIIICNPNNPTGAAVDKSAIRQLLDAAPDSAVLVDEAYFEFYGETMAVMVGRVPNLFIARTFSKAYGLAGVRIGVLCGPASQISVIRRIASPFNLNAFALECLEEALADREFVNSYVSQVKNTRAWLTQQLGALGLKCWPSHANFILCRIGDNKKTVLAELRARGIGLRDRSDCEGCVRITIGTQKEMERVVAALQQVTGKPAPERVSR